MFWYLPSVNNLIPRLILCIFEISRSSFLSCEWTALLLLMTIFVCVPQYSLSSTSTWCARGRKFWVTWRTTAKWNNSLRSCHAQQTDRTENRNKRITFKSHTKDLKKKKEDKVLSIKQARYAEWLLTILFWSRTVAVGDFRDPVTTQMAFPQFRGRRMTFPY